MTDSPYWDWGGGFCKLHPGNVLPCQVCIHQLHPALVRDEVVEEMMDTWERGEVYSKPYTVHEPKVAAERFRQSGRVCPPTPTEGLPGNTFVPPSFSAKLLDSYKKWGQRLPTPEMARELGLNDGAFPIVEQFKTRVPVDLLIGTIVASEDLLKQIALWGDDVFEELESLGYSPEAVAKLRESSMDERERDALIIKLYDAQPLAADALLGTPYLTRMAESMIEQTGVKLSVAQMESSIFQRIIKIRKAGNLPTKGR